jgi:ornithine decarboxylase
MASAVSNPPNVPPSANRSPGRYSNNNTNTKVITGVADKPPPAIPFPINGKDTYTPKQRTFGVRPNWADVRPYAALDPSRAASAIYTGGRRNQAMAQQQQQQQQQLSSPPLEPLSEPPISLVSSQARERALSDLDMSTLGPSATSQGAATADTPDSDDYTLVSDASIFVVAHDQENDAYVTNAISDVDLDGGIVIAHVPVSDIHDLESMNQTDLDTITDIKAQIDDEVALDAIEDIAIEEVVEPDTDTVVDKLNEMINFYRDEEIMETMLEKDEEATPKLKELLTKTKNSLEYDTPVRAVMDKYRCMSIAEGGPLSIKKLAAAYILDTDIDDSFYIMDLANVQRLYDAWHTAMPRVTPFYAVKCSPMKEVVDLLVANGCGFDCASANEIQLALDAGVSQENIIFAHPAKRPTDIRFARDKNVKKTTFDSAIELEKIKKWHPNADCVLRIRADDPEAGISFGIKYGASPDEYEPLIKKCVELGLNLVGVSFHVGSLARSGAAFNAAITQARVAFDCAKTLGFHLTFLDIGGGFTGRFNSNGVVQSMVGDIPANINEALEEHFGDKSPFKDTKVVAEPGRYFAEASMHLCCHVHSVRNRDDGAGGDAFCDYLISDGLYGSFNCVVYDGAKPRAWLLPSPTLPPLETNLIRSTVFGPTCDSMDCVFKDVMLPQLRVGDWMLFPNFGAYTLAGATNFNGIMAAEPKIIYVSSGASVDTEDSLVMWACEMEQPPSAIVAA